MSESAKCVEQREEQTELEEAGGAAEVRRFYIRHRLLLHIHILVSNPLLKILHPPPTRLFTEGFSSLASETFTLSTQCRLPEAS